MSKGTILRNEDQKVTKSRFIICLAVGLIAFKYKSLLGMRVKRLEDQPELTNTVGNTWQTLSERVFRALHQIILSLGSR